MYTIRQFKGLTNTADPLRKGLGWLSVADNVNVTNTGALSKRDGYTKVRSGNFASVFTTFDFRRMYAVVDNQLVNFDGTVLATLASTAPMYWTELNDQVFFNNGVDSGIIRQDDSVIPWRWEVPTAPLLSCKSDEGSPNALLQVRCTYTLADGRETGAGEAVAAYWSSSDGVVSITSVPNVQNCVTNVYVAAANSSVFQHLCTTRASAVTYDGNPDHLGRELLTAFLDPLPFGADVICAWKGRIYAAHHMPVEGQTAIWFSEPLGFHLFNLNSNFIMVPGHVRLLSKHEDGLLIGTDERVFTYDGTSLKQIADYGVIPGRHDDRDDDGTVYFWTTRGVCSALPFMNLTEKQISVAPGVRAGGCIVKTGGQKRFLSVLQRGGSPFNAL